MILKVYFSVLCFSVKDTGRLSLWCNFFESFFLNSLLILAAYCIKIREYLWISYWHFPINRWPDWTWVSLGFLKNTNSQWWMSCHQVFNSGDESNIINLLWASERSAGHCHIVWDGDCVRWTLLVRGDLDPGSSHDSEASSHTFPTISHNLASVNNQI